MRKITKLAVNSFINNKPLSKSNMQVRIEEEATYMYLHGNLIAKKINNIVSINNAGWTSNVTKERLNGIIQNTNTEWTGIYHRNFQWYIFKHLNGVTIKEKIFPKNEWFKL